MDEVRKTESIPLAETPIPSHEPYLPVELVQSALQSLSGVTDAVFRPWISERVTLIWLENESKRLGMTRFEDGPTELVRRRTLSLDPGPITIGLHPRLVEEPDLLKHTLAHELVHASGVLNHSKQLHDAVDGIAPGVSISESPLLRDMRDQFLGTARVKSWTCKHCGYEWKRSTVRKPLRCHKCARPL